MKTCTGCKIEQAIECFPQRGSEKGRTSRCQACRREAQRDYRRRHKARDRVKQRARLQDPAARRLAAIAHRRRKYGLTEEQYDGMLISQCGRCAICHDMVQDPHVDHCHASDLVRGLLCGRCNRAIGLLQDDPVRVQSAMVYLMEAVMPCP